TGDRADLNDEQRRRIARPLAHFLRALHAIDPNLVGAPLENLGRLDLKKRRPQLERRLAEAVTLELIEDAEPWLQALHDTPSDYAPQNKTLVQGDLYSRHILVDHEGMLSGVIDWGDIHVGDVAVDLAIAHSFLLADARQEFRAEYGLIDET